GLPDLQSARRMFKMRQSFLASWSMIMTKNSLVLFIIALAAILALASRNHAADSPADTAFTPISDEDLHKMLDNMGFAPTKLGKGYLIAIKRDDWTFNIQLVLSNDRTKLGFNSNLGKVDDTDPVTAAQWKDLLIANGDIDPSFFFFDKDQKKL